MKSWKLLAGTVVMAIGLSGAALAQPQDWDHQDGRATVNSNRDHMRDGDDRRDRDDRDRDRRDRGNWQYRGERDRDNRGYGNYGYYPNRRGDGDRDDSYRNGQWGYRQGGYGAYDNGAHNGRSGYRGSSAAQFGYQDGLNYGQRDASSGRGYNATGSEYYENADHGYNSSFGDKNGYRQEYRQAYQQGYRDGYQQRY